MTKLIDKTNKHVHDFDISFLKINLVVNSFVEYGFERNFCCFSFYMFKFSNYKLKCILDIWHLHNLLNCYLTGIQHVKINIVCYNY
jgi:hypothetical protein